MDSDSEEGVLPEEIRQAVTQGDFERVKAWLAGGSASDPRSINARDHTDWTLLHWTVVSAGNDITLGHIEFARYLISQGVRVDAKSSEESTALHFACGSITGGDIAAAMVSMLVAAGATVNMGRRNGDPPLFSIYHFSESSIDVVTILLRAGASLDFQHRLKGPQSFEEHLDHVIALEDDINLDPDQLEHVGAIRSLVASVRAAGSWKAHCRLPHKQILRLRSLVARGQMRERLATTRAIRFIVRQGDNGIVWNILSFWRATD